MAGIVQAGMSKQPDAKYDAIAGVIESKVNKFPEIVVKKITDGQGDLEMEMADTAANLVRAELGDQKLDERTVMRLCGIVIASLMRFAVGAKLVAPNEVKRLGQRATVMAEYMVENGPGSLQ